MFSARIWTKRIEGMLHFSLHNIVSKINCCLDSIMLLLDSMDSIGLPLQASCALTAPLQGLYLWAVTPFYLLNPVTLIEINIRYFWFVIEIPCIFFFPFFFLLFCLFSFYFFCGGGLFWERGEEDGATRKLCLSILSDTSTAVKKKHEMLSFL